MLGKLYILPSPIVEGEVDQLPDSTQNLFRTLQYFAAENVRTTRRLLKRIDPSINIDELTFFEVSKKTSETDLQPVLAALKQGQEVGVVSESGCPGIADPGSLLIRRAHELKCKVLPAVGPSSVYLSLMASGLNGQHFQFHGYLPLPKKGLEPKLSELVQLVNKTGATQIWIETPYRNNQHYQILIDQLPPQMLLCIGCRVLANDGWVNTQRVLEWKLRESPDLHKKESIFLIGQY